MINKLYSKIDREIDSIIEARFFHYDNNDTFNHEYLCYVFNFGEYRILWEYYWDKFNTRKYGFISSYTHSYDNGVIVSALTRLLIVEDFKLYCYHKMKKRK